VRKFTLIATVIVLLANATWVVKTHAQWPQTTMPDSRFSVEFGARAYDRPGSELGAPVVTDGTTGSVLLDATQAADLGNTVGAEVKFNFLTKYGREIEIRSIIADWDESYEFAATSLITPFFPAPGTAPSSMTFDYESDFFSFEIMSRKAIKPGMTLMFGPRYVSSKDQVTVTGTRLVDPGGGTTPFDLVTSQTTEASNGLIGLQCGCEFNFPVTQDVYLNSFIRTGGYYNPTEANTSVIDDFTDVLVTTTQSESTGSFLGEVGGRLYVDIVPNCFATYVGYEATWIDGFATAPAQILIPASSGIDTANTSFFQAITFGARLTY
jgi:hypothetical protein